MGGNSYTFTSDDYDGHSLAVGAPAPSRHTPNHLQESFLAKVREDFDYLPIPWLRANDDWQSWGEGGQNLPFLGTSGTVSDRRGGRDVPLFWNEIDLRFHRIMSRWLCDSNPFAIGFLGRLVDYHVRKGFGWQACMRGGKKIPYAGPGSSPLIIRAQNILDVWRDANMWPVKSREAFRRWCRDGETFGRFFSGGWDRLPAFRFAEPEQIGSPDGMTDGAESFGIRCDADDVETKRAYHVWSMEEPGVGDWIDAEGVVHVMRNVDGTVKRGIPDFYPLYSSLENARRMVDSIIVTSLRQAAIAWREQFPTATSQQIGAMVPMMGGQPVGPEAAATSLPGGFGRRRNGYPPGTVQRTEGNRQFADGPTAAGNANFLLTVAAAIRACCVRWGFPEYVGSADASNNNFASLLVSDSPMAVSIDGTQLVWGSCWERPIALKVLDHAMRAGYLTYAERRQLDVEVTEPANHSNQPLEDTQRRSLLNEKFVTCLDTWRQEEGYDPQHESEGIIRDQKAKAKAAAATNQPPSPAAPPGGPAPTPLGESRIIPAKDTSPIDPPENLFAESTLVDRLITVHGPHGTYQVTRKVRADGPPHVDHPAANNLHDSIQSSPGLSDEQRAEYHAAAHAVLSRITPFGRDRIVKGMTSAKFYPDVESLGVGVCDEALKKPDLSDDQRAKITAQREAIESGKYAIGGAYLAHNGQVHLDGAFHATAQTGPMPGRHGGVEQNAAQVYAHELGHAIDGPTLTISRSARWQEIMDKEIGRKGNVGGEPRLTLYAQSKPQEGLAEWCRLVYGGQVPLGQVETEFPLATKFFKEAQLWPS